MNTHKKRNNEAKENNLQTTYKLCLHNNCQFHVCKNSKMFEVNKQESSDQLLSRVKKQHSICKGKEPSIVRALNADRLQMVLVNQLA
jgi:hypothetical protein